MNAESTPAPEVVEEVDPSFDPKIIADLRLYREHKREAGQWKGLSVPLFTFEIDALLAAVDERDALKREAVALRDDAPRRWRREPAEIIEAARVYLDPSHRRDEAGGAIPVNRRRPTEAVAAVLSVSLRTASRLVDDARRVGVVPPWGSSDADLDAAFYLLDA